MKGVVIGVTGGVATGKSALAGLWRRAGAAYYSVDAAAHALYAPGTGVTAALAARFGPGILGPDGAVNRPRLADSALRDGPSLRALDVIVHPPLARAAAAALRRLAARHPAVVVEAGPLLFALGLDRLCDRVVLVRCARAERVRRLAASRAPGGVGTGRRLGVFGAAERRMERAARGRRNLTVVRTDVPAPRLASLAAGFWRRAGGR